MAFKDYYKENTDKETFSEKVDKKLFSIIESINNLNKIPKHEKTEIAMKLEAVLKEKLKLEKG